MIITRKDKTRFNDALYTSFDNEFTELGQKNGLYQDKGLLGTGIGLYQKYVIGGASRAQSQGQQIITAQQIAGDILKKQKELDWQLNNAEKLKALEQTSPDKAYQILLERYKSPEAALAAMQKAYSLTTEGPLAEKYAAIMAHAAENITGTLNPSTERVEGILMQRIRRTTGDYLSNLNTPTGFYDDLYILPDGATSLMARQANDFYGYELPTAKSFFATDGKKMVDYSRTEDENYEFIFDDGSTQKIDKKYVMKRVMMDGSDQTVELDPDAVIRYAFKGFTDHNGRKLNYNETIAYVGQHSLYKRDKHGRVIGVDYSELGKQAEDALQDNNYYDQEKLKSYIPKQNNAFYYIEADEAHRIKFDENHLNQKSKALFKLLRKSLGDEGAYPIAEGFGNEGIMGALIQAVLVLLNKKDKDHKFKKAEDWEKELGHKPTATDVLGQIDNLDPAQKAVLDQIVKVEERDKGNGKKEKVLVMKVDPSDNIPNNEIVLTEDEAKRFMKAFDEGKQAEFMSQVLAQEKNLHIKEFNEAYGYDPQTKKITPEKATDNAGIKYDAVVLTIQEKKEFLDALDGIYKLGNPAKNFDAFKAELKINNNEQLAARMLENFRRAVIDEGTKDSKFDAEVGTYDGIKKFSGAENMQYFSALVNDRAIHR